MSDLFIGLMSGTSADGIDAALLDIRPDEQDFSLIGTYHLEYTPEFRSRLLHLSLTPNCSKRELGSIGTLLADQSATAIHRLLQKTGHHPTQICAIGSHGHTIDHAPDHTHPYSLQIGDHARLTELTGISTVSDFRSRDIAAGGQGAPLVPAFHDWLFHLQRNKQPALTQNGSAAVINIGGISNITLLQSGLGYDCGPGNCLIDQWHQQHTGQLFDDNGATAAAGNLLTELLTQMMQDKYFRAPPPKSTGREYFNKTWLEQQFNHCNLDLNKTHWVDISYTLTALTAKTIAWALLEHNISHAWLCGGGSHNTLMRSLIATETPSCTLMSTEQLGIEPDWVEACAFAWLAMRTIRGKSGNQPTATGASGTRVLGCIYPV